MKKIILLLLPLSIFAQSYDVLFLGNSYTFYNQMPNMVSEIATSMGDTVVAESNTPGGWKLEQHAQAGSSSLQKISEKQWDFVVIQGQSNETSFPPFQVAEETYPYAESLVNAIEDNYECTEPIFYMTWGRKNGDNINGQQYPIISSYLGMQQRVRESYLEMGMDNEATVAPVGMAWKKSIQDNPNFELYTGDESHPNMAGSYLAACVFYCTIFQESCVGSSYLPNGVSQEDATTLQTIASSVVLDSTQVWNMFAIQSADTVMLNDSSYTFSASASNYDNLEWDFGDGTTANTPTANHTFDEGQHTVNLNVFSNGEDCLEKTITFEINISGVADTTTTDTTTYISDLNNTFKLYPNPATNYISIEGVEANSHLKIYNVLGKVVLEQSISKDQRINLSTLTQVGQYIVELRSEDKVNTFKLIKNE